MARKGAGGRVQIVLGFICVALAGVIYAELDPAASEPTANAAPSRPAAGQSTQTIAAPSFAMPPLRNYVEVTSRPLFSQTRRPPPEAPRSPPAQASSFTLVGIVLSERGRHAIIEHGQPPRLDRVSEGQELDGWFIETIAASKVTIRYRNTSEEIKPKDKPARTPQSRPSQRKG
jgi:general secretion pathway protein N